MNRLGYDKWRVSSGFQEKHLLRKREGERRGGGEEGKGGRGGEAAV